MTWRVLAQAALQRIHVRLRLCLSGKRTPATGGLEESQQLLAAVQYVRSLGAEEVVVWGFSMGAGTALQAALKTDASDRIDAMLLDSLFLPSSDSLFNNARQYMKALPRYPSMPLIKWMLPFFTGVQLDHLPVKQVLSTSYPIPIFIMHGSDDAVASVSIAGNRLRSSMTPCLEPGSCRAGSMNRPEPGPKNTFSCSIFLSRSGRITCGGFGGLDSLSA